MTLNLPNFLYICQEETEWHVWCIWKVKTALHMFMKTYLFGTRKQKKAKSKRKCIGHLDPETGTVQPNGRRGGSRKNSVTTSEKNCQSVSLTAAALLPCLTRCVLILSWATSWKRHFPMIIVLSWRVHIISSAKDRHYPGLKSGPHRRLPPMGRCLPTNVSANFWYGLHQIFHRRFSRHGSGRTGMPGTTADRDMVWHH